MHHYNDEITILYLSTNMEYNNVQFSLLLHHEKLTILQIHIFTMESPSILELQQCKTKILISQDNTKKALPKLSSQEYGFHNL